MLKSAKKCLSAKALFERLRDIRGRVTNLYNKVRKRKTLKDIVEEVNYNGIEDVKHMFGRKKAEQTNGLEDIKRMYGKARSRGENDRTEEDDEPKLIEDGDRVKTWRIGKSLNSPLTKTVMAIITPHVDMRVVVVYSFSCDIYQRDGGVTDYHKSKSTKGSLSSLAEIEAFIEACEMQRLDIEDGQWIEAMAEQTGRHIHHALCGHGGERVMRELNFLKDLYKLRANYQDCLRIQRVQVTWVSLSTG